jgi:hypothetical protein
MKKNYVLVLTALITSLSFGQDLIITGVYDGPLFGGTPKGVEVFALADIPDLSIYALGSANNGDGSDGEEFTFPANPVTAGTFIYVASESTQFNNFFGFAPNFTSGAMEINGDDAVELFMNGSVVDLFGAIDTDGTGEAWEYLDGWAYRKNNSTPSSTFNVSDWEFSGPNALDGETSNATSATPFPIGSYVDSTLSQNEFLTQVFTLYPNPTNTGKITISSLHSETISVSIYNVLGKEVTNQKLGDTGELNLSTLKAGVYFARISQNDASVTKKLVIR